jgi:hypothetical protein
VTAALLSLSSVWALSTFWATPWAADGPAARVMIESGRTTVIEAGPLVGAPIERTVKSEAYAAAVAKDREQRWTDAATYYQQAVNEWSAKSRFNPAVDLDRAVYKADRERQRSLLLAAVQSRRDKLPAATMRALALERARAYRTKLMSVRAFTGAVPMALYVRTRQELDEALRLGEPGKPTSQQTEARLLLCAARAAAGELAPARLDLAAVSSAERDDSTNTLPLAICHAALGDLPQALTLLETFVLRQPPEQRLDAYALRDLYLSNDWDRLRGDRRFERLFASLHR